MDRQDREGYCCRRGQGLMVNGASLAGPREPRTRAGVLSCFIFQTNFFSFSVEDGSDRIVREAVAYIQMRAHNGLDPELRQWL